MSVPSDSKVFVFTPTKAKDAKDDPKTITIPALAWLPRDYAMIEASVDGNDNRFIVAAFRSLRDKDLEAQLRALSADDYGRFLKEWSAQSRTSPGE
jgi:hypothetical protein